MYYSMQAKVKKKMQQDPPEISVQFHTVCARLAADFQVLISLYSLPCCLCRGGEFLLRN
jgi:hypothetical protein